MKIDELARASSGERDAYFRIAGGERRIAPTIIEKDFWVCWLLARIFELSDAPYFTFKGGTSLSKVFKVVSRFSEDIDISVKRSRLGFADAHVLF